MITRPAADYKDPVNGGTRAVMSYSNADEPADVALVGYVAETELHYVRCINPKTFTCSCSVTNTKKTYADAVSECLTTGTRPPTVAEVRSWKVVGMYPKHMFAFRNFFALRDFKAFYEILWSRSK